MGDKGGGGLDGRKVKFGPGPHERILVDICTDSEYRISLNLSVESN